MENIRSKLVTKMSEEDENFIQAGQNDEEKNFRRNLIVSALALNGSFDAADPGVAVSYIPEDNYNYLFIPDVKTLPTAYCNIIEQALNWNALGRGKGGLAGASVRFSLRNYFAQDRECKVVTQLSKEISEIVKEYSLYSAQHSKFAGVWFANAWNVVGLAASCFIRECHHWNAQNNKAIKALIGSLSQENELPENEYRKVFYLAIHPLPLKVLAQVITMSKDPNQTYLSETVKLRLRVAPAGYADFCACAIAAQSFIREDYATKTKLIRQIVEMLHAAETIKNNPVPYHPFAAHMGVQKVDFQKAPYTEAMIVLAAYAKACIGGTLSNSPALTRFINEHLRKVNVLSQSFKEFNDRQSEDLMKVLLGEEEITIENIVEKVKPVAKVMERLKDISDSKAITQATTLLEERITEMITNLGVVKGHEIDISSIKPPDMPTQTIKFKVVQSDARDIIS